MNRGPFITIGILVGSFVGSLIPELWGADMFSFSSLIFGALGSILGIYIAFYFIR